MKKLRAADANQIESSLSVAAMFAGYLKEDAYPKIINGELVPQELTEEDRELFLQGIKTRLIDVLNDIRLIESFERRHHGAPLSVYQTEGEIAAITRYLVDSLPKPMSQKMKDFLAA